MQQEKKNNKPKKGTVEYDKQKADKQAHAAIRDFWLGCLFILFQLLAFIVAVYVPDRYEVRGEDAFSIRLEISFLCIFMILLFGLIVINLHAIGWYRSSKAIRIAKKHNWATTTRLKVYHLLLIVLTVLYILLIIWYFNH